MLWARQPPGPYLRITAPGDQPRACVSTVGLTGRTPRRRLTASPGRLERLRPAPTAASFSARPGTPTQFQLLAIEPFALTTLTPFAPDPVSVHSSHVVRPGASSSRGEGRRGGWRDGRWSCAEDVLKVGIGLRSLSLAVVISEQTMAQRSAPPSEPANRWFLRPRAIGRMARSTVLVSSSTRPSSR